ncbi:uncharacterized protein LOC111112451 [Crassostrea virginica]
MVHQSICLLYFTLKKGCSSVLKLHILHVYCISDELTISTSFTNGNVLFSWGNLEKKFYDVKINNGAWSRVSEPKYIVKDALKYDYISILIRGFEERSLKDYTLTYKVSKISKTIGDSVNISWIAPFFPQAGVYTIFHTNKENSIESIIEVTSNNVITRNSKYEYLSQPFNSTNITFMIRDLTLDDAGYYAGGYRMEHAWSGNGVVLIVLEKPSTPYILGTLNITVGNICKLTCLSTSSSAPDYYVKLVKLSYRWFVNGTDVGERSKDINFTVTKNHQYNQYSCEALEKNLVSERSDPIQINPLYKPDMLSIKPEPQLLNGKLTVTEGETIGPYHCSADCNPPCSITWEYKDTDGTIHDAS